MLFFVSGRDTTVTLTGVHGAPLLIATSDAGCRASTPDSSLCVTLLSLDTEKNSAKFVFTCISGFN